MKKYYLFLILGSSSFIVGQQPPQQQQVIQQTLGELALLRNELGKPLVPNNNAPAQLLEPAQAAVEAKKRQLAGAAFDRLSSKIFDARTSTRMPRITQEAIAHVALATAAAHESALEEQFNKKGLSFAHAQTKRVEAEQELGTLQEIKELQERQKQETAAFEHACKDLVFLREVKELDDKLSRLSSQLWTDDLQLTQEIMAAQDAVRALKHPTH